MGPAAVLVEDPPGEPAAWSRGFRRLDVAGVVDVVPAARTVLVRCRTSADLPAVIDRLGDVAVDLASAVESDNITIDVTYDGEDLAAVAAATGLSAADVVRLHSEASYTVAFCGFAPGFGYLAGLPAALHLPRRASPRTVVPAGSVAIASEYTAVYPRSSPGGWHLLGSTTAVLFDPGRQPPAMFRPGVAVRFRPVR